VTEYTELSDLRDDSLKCKYPGIRHAWDGLPESSYDLNDFERSYYADSILALRCERCGREKFEFFDVNGNRMGKPAYRNPTDFQHTHRLYADEIRLELMSRNLLVNNFKKRTATDARRALKERRTANGK
jgi:hypothetical protein